MFFNALVSSFSDLTWLILIASGIISILAFIERLATVLEKEELAEWLKFISIFGFIFGIASLIVTAFNFIGPHLDPPVTSIQTTWEILLTGLALGLTLTLKPIKNMKWASLVSLSAGIGVSLLIWITIPSAPAPILIGLGVLTLLILYLALKFIEDFYLLISSIVTSPPLTVGLGIIGLVEGLLLMANTSIITIFTGG